jgi:hypothetical protein
MNFLDRVQEKPFGTHICGAIFTQACAKRAQKEKCWQTVRGP